MSTPYFPVLDCNDPRLKLTVENRIRHIFVTQPEDIRNKGDDENINYIPVVTESPSRVLEAGVNTLQKTLVLKKQAELDEVDNQLILRRQHFKNCVEALAQKRSELELRQQQTQERVMKFERFVAENEVKRHRALKKYEAAHEQNILKQREIEDLTEQLQQLRSRRQVLKERMAKYKIYGDFLKVALDNLSGTHLDNGSESSVMPVIQRHETLSFTHQKLLQRIGSLEQEVEQSWRHLETMKHEHNIRKLMYSKKLSDLQSKLEILVQDNKQADSNLLMQQSLSREKAVGDGTLFMAVNNLAEQCYLEAYGPLQNMSMPTMMDMVKEYILDKTDTKKRATRLMESGSAVMSRTALTDRKQRVAMKSLSSKSQITSASKVNRKSEVLR
ncbi:uncharacterized protein V6R79_025123 [Siganus canaliculatus]